MSCLTCYRSVSIGVVSGSEKLHCLGEGSALGLGSSCVLGGNFGQCPPTVIAGTHYCPVASTGSDNAGCFQLLICPGDCMGCHVQYTCQVPDGRQFRPHGENA